MKKLIKITILILWMILIYYFSNQVGNVSQDISDNLLGKSYSFFLRFINLDYNEFILKYGYYFRKLAHIFEYFILGILVYLNLEEYFESKIAIISILVCLIYAISDEVHQLFIVDRSFGYKDILIDSLGYLIGISFISFVRNKWLRNI